MLTAAWMLGPSFESLQGAVQPRRAAFGMTHASANQLVQIIARRPDVTPLVGSGA